MKKYSIEWCNDYNLGIPLIDKQHQTIGRLITEVKKAMDVSVSGKRIAEVLHELKAYADNHFSYEERMLEKYKYLDIEEHKGKHKNLIRDLNVFYKEKFEFIEGRKDIDQKGKREILDFLICWLMDHIMVEDKKYAPHILLVTEKNFNDMEKESF